MSQTSTQDRRPQLLVVDDEPANLQVLRHILQEDYRLLFAKDGAKALELAAREKPELILLDVMMPGMTGYQVCAQLKATPATSAIPVIFVTALADVEDEAQGFAVGAGGLLINVDLGDSTGDTDTFYVPTPYSYIDPATHVLTINATEGADVLTVSTVGTIFAVFSVNAICTVSTVLTIYSIVTIFTISTNYNTKVRNSII